MLGQGAREFGGAGLGDRADHVVFAEGEGTGELTEGQLVRGDHLGGLAEGASGEEDLGRAALDRCGALDVGVETLDGGLALVDLGAGLVVPVGGGEGLEFGGEAGPLLVQLAHVRWTPGVSIATW